jgi:hypothetical protein
MTSASQSRAKTVHIVQILLPVFDNEGRKFDASHYTDVRTELADRFGGLTAYSRAPAEGLWGNEGGMKRDDIVVFEVMVEKVDRKWWSSYRKALEKRLRQDSIIMRVLSSEVL